MKESKSAGFTNISFTADFDGGNLVSVTALSREGIKNTLSSEEVQELSDWLRTAVLKENPYLSKHDGDDLKASTESSLSDMVVGVSAQGQGRKISDAESVKNRIPIEKALASGGMFLETKSINPITVNIGGPAVPEVKK